MSIAALLADFRRHALTPVEYWDQLALRIDAWEPSINALYAYDPAAARKQAEESAARWKKGEPIGPLDGVPVSVKELIASEGLPVPMGTAAFPLLEAAADAPPVAGSR